MATIIHEISTEEEKKQFFAFAPPNLSKYRDWANEFHKRIFTENELFFSSPKWFNDPFDCGLPFRQHPENSDPVVIKEVLERSAINVHPNLKNNPIALQEKCAKQILLIQQNPASWFELNWGYYPEELHRLFGVISLTPYPDNYLMWSHYANAHKGFCAVFDTRLLVESVAGHYEKVRYEDSIPLFSIRDNLQDELITKLIYTKSNMWSYEDEYRISRIYKPDKPVLYNPAALKSVYFGCKTPIDHQLEIIELVRKKFPWVTFHKMIQDNESFKLNVGDLNIF